MEMLTRRLCTCIKEKHLDKDFFPKKKLGQVCHQWIPLTRLVLLAQDSYRIEWHGEQVAKLNIDKQRIVADMAFRDREVPVVEWG